MAQSAAHKHESAHQATYQDVLDAPAHRVAESIGGTLYTNPRPAAPHARASSSATNRTVPALGRFEHEIASHRTDPTTRPHAPEWPLSSTFTFSSADRPS